MHLSNINNYISIFKGFNNEIKWLEGKREMMIIFQE